MGISHRKVAIKLLTTERHEDDEWLKRFYREAKIAGALNHPNVLTIHEVGEEHGSPYLATEFVDGMTLGKALRSTRPSPGQIVHYSSQLANGMAAAHAAGIIHRDLKPDNVMLRADGLLKILDFELAKYSSRLQIARRLKVNIRCGADMGACNIGNELTGSAAVQSQSIAANAPYFGVLVSESLKNIVAGSGLEFVEHSIFPGAEKQLMFQLIS